MAQQDLTLPTCKEVAWLFGFAARHPWETIPHQLGLVALGNSIAPPMAALFLRQPVGIWMVTNDLAEFDAQPPDSTDPA
eukprot:2344179-Prorocentrum_lima.AAC.1